MRREKPRREFATTPLLAARRAWAQRALVCLMDGLVSPRPRGKAGRKLSTNDAHTGLAPQRRPICGAFRVSCLNRLNRRPVIGAVRKMFSPSYTVLEAASSQLPKTRCVWGRTIAR